MRFSFTISSLFLLICLLLLTVQPSEAFRYENDETGSDFILVGVGVFRQHLTSVDGNEVLFEDSDDGLPTNYSNRSYLSLYGEGQLYKGWGFTLDAQYDEEDPDQDFTFLMELYKDKNYAVIGDHEDGTFLDTVFTASDDKMRGVTLHGENNAFGVTAMAGAVRGESTTEEIRGDGTSGRYRLSEAPVIRGSEKVRIEIRDRNSPTRVIKSTSQIRGRDYTIDYDRGEILFTRPVEESDFRGNPAFIVVSYQYDTPGGLYKRFRYGSRATVDVNADLRIGTTFLADSDWDSGFSSSIVDDRLQIIGTDINYNHNNRHLVSVELARSNIPSQETDSDDTALRADLMTSPLPELVLRANYWRVGADFLTFGNYDLSSDNVIIGSENDSPFYFVSHSLDFDLDPNNSASLGTDMESYGASGSYTFQSHTASAGFRHSRDNIPEDEERSVNQQDTYFAVLSDIGQEGTGYMIGTELFVNTGDGEDAINDSRTSRLVGGIKHLIGQSTVTGPVFFQGAYQYEQFDDQDDEDNSTKTHDLLGRIEFLPISNFMIYVEGGFNYLYRESEGDFSERSLVGLLGGEGEINRYFQLDGIIKYRTYQDLVEDRQSRLEESLFLRWQSRPTDLVRTSLHVEYRQDEDFIAESETTKTLLGADIWWDIRSDLLFHGSYEREWNKSSVASGTDETTGYDDILFRIDWRLTDDLSLFAYYRLEYDELETEPLDATRVRTTTEMVGAKYKFSHNLEAVAAYRRKTLDEDDDNYKMKAYGELVYSLNSYLSVAPGFEHSRYDEDDGEDYEANVLYINLIGKL